MNHDLRIIKKKYGESMMKLCRDFFPTLLEQEGLLSQTILDKFETLHDLYDDIVSNELDVEFKNYIYSFVNKEEDVKPVDVTKTPKELLNEAGYILYECHNEEDIQAFKKYFNEDEELCTFRGNRLNRCHVFFAVKKNVDEIKREDFDKPKRQDLYGTSVISIQFTKDESHTLSIKNRYNHTVNNPDATFNNNLENIIPGLTESFEKYYGMVQKYKNNRFEIPSYVCVNGKYYKYNYEINNVYYCPDNIIIDNFKVKKLEKEKYILLDYFVLDLQRKNIELYDKTICDSFVDGINNIKTIEIERLKKNKKLTIKNSNKDIIIELDKDNNIIEYTNENIKRIGNSFLHLNKSLTKLSLPQLEEIGNDFLVKNNSIIELSLPQVKEIGNCFLISNYILNKLSLPQVSKIGHGFLGYNNTLKELSLPQLQEIGDDFLYYTTLTKISLPQVKEIGHGFLCYNSKLEKLSLPQAKKIGDNFLYYTTLKELLLPQVRKIGQSFLCYNNELIELSLPQVKEIGDDFLCYNTVLEKIFMPQAKKIGDNFLTNCYSPKIFYMPNIDRNYYKNIPSLLQQSIITKEQIGEINEEIKNRRNR